AVDQDGDRLAGLARGEGERPRGGLVVAAGGGGAGGRGVVGRDRDVGGPGEVYAERERGLGRVALGADHEVGREAEDVDTRDADARLVVADGAHTLGFDEPRPRRPAEVDEEGLVGLADAVPVDGDDDGLTGLSRGEAERPGDGLVVAAGGGGA